MMPQRHSDRDRDGRFSAKPATLVTLPAALAIYNTYLAAVCARKGLTPHGVQVQLAQAGEHNFNPMWRAASYARQLAMYLTNTQHSVPQKLIARITGLSPPAVCIALQSIEDLRDHSDFDALIDIIATQMQVTP